MPDLRLTTLDGRKIEQLGKYRGKVVVLDFWASWCATCYSTLTEIQKTIETHPEWSEKVVYIAATLDQDFNKAKRVIEKNQWDGFLHRSVDTTELNKEGISVIPLMAIVTSKGAIFTMAGSHAIDLEAELELLLSKE